MYDKVGGEIVDVQPAGFGERRHFPDLRQIRLHGDAAPHMLKYGLALDVLLHDSLRVDIDEEALKEERLAARLNSIEKNLEENNAKLDIHNGYAEKIGSIQRDMAYIRGKMEGDKA